MEQVQFQVWMLLASLQKRYVLCLPVIAILVTGCPRNEYVVELKPRGKVMERKLVFYREDGKDTNGVPKYQSFPAEELEAIAKLYPATGVTRKGERQTAQSEFAGAMPADVGGAGTYTNFITSLGSAGCYAERFRGTDDLAAMAEKRIAAVNHLADLIVGWSQAELGEEPHYADLRKFLDVDFRNDLKNASLYYWQGQVIAGYQTNATEEFGVRFGQYLMERGYFSIGNVPELFHLAAMENEKGWSAYVQRLLARKLGVADTDPLPASLLFLSDPDTMSKSFEKYLAGSEAYRARLAQWEEEKKAKPDAQKPGPRDVAGELFEELVDWNLFGRPDDHLVVKLSLPSAPTHTNGKWDEAKKQVVWESELEGRTNAARLPVFCYASWTRPDESFQRKHFRGTILTGDKLLEYCLWRAALDDKQAGEWEALVAGLQPGGDSDERIDKFRFSDEKPLVEPDKPETSPSHLGRELLHETSEAKADAAKSR